MKPRKPLKVSEERTLQTYGVSAGIYAYRLTAVTTSGRRAPKRKVTEGFTTKAGLEHFASGAGGTPGHCPAVVGTPEFREFVRTQGWADSENFVRLVQAVSDPYTRLVEGTLSRDDVVVLEMSGHMLFDVDGAVLPCAVHFDYSDGRMENTQYDLKKALALLQGRADVRFGGDDGDKIQRIPHYNASRMRHSFIDFVWTPSVEDYRRMWEKCLSYDRYPSTNTHRAVFDLDLLGLRAGGAALRGDYYHYEDEPRDEDED